jgi:hypothetical protein
MVYGEERGDEGKEAKVSRKDLTPFEKREER